jgi:phage repressor protein C with HTH and peptisase S24 domain
MSLDWLYAIRGTYAANFHWLVTGEGPMLADEAVAERMTEHKADVYQAAKELAAGVPSEFVVVPVVQGRISAGGGLEPDNRVDMAVAFRREWIERKGDVERMSVVRVQGDSMIPTLQPGDIILVNHNIDAVTANGGIYAIAFKNEIIVKRVELIFPSGQLRIVSDNKDYGEFQADPAQVSINGKVIWYGRDLER